jgi:hypothetical protein
VRNRHASKEDLNYDQNRKCHAHQFVAPRRILRRNQSLSKMLRCRNRFLVVEFAGDSVSASAVGALLVAGNTQ